MADESLQNFRVFRPQLTGNLWRCITPDAPNLTEFALEKGRGNKCSLRWAKGAIDALHKGDENYSVRYANFVLNVYQKMRIKL